MTKKYFITLAASILFIWGCSKENANNLQNNIPAADNLHLSFYTPDWNARINCDRLEMDATTSGYITGTSQSTNETFYLTVPTDSSVWNDPTNVKTYPIGLGAIFNFNQTLPIVKGSSTRLIGINQQTSDSYHKINSITYDHSDNTGAYFKIKANYKMVMKVLYSNTMDTLKNVYGDYTFLIKTNKR